MITPIIATITIDKQSKKKQKKFYSKQRRNWGELKPWTKIFKSKNLRDERAKDRGKDYE